MKLVTWNVNSINKRFNLLCEYLETEAPDIVFLQEIKCNEDQFPFLSLNMKGYKAVCSLQEQRHGVAILSKHPVSLIRQELQPYIFDRNKEARYVEAEVFIDDQRLKVASVYVPAGGFNDVSKLSPEEREKLEVKISFLRRLYKHVKENPVSILAGDFNIAPRLIDMYDPEKQNFICCSQKERSVFKAFLDLGFENAFNQVHPNEQAFSWWSYQFGHYAQNWGYRLDHILCRQGLFKYQEARIDSQKTMNRPDSSDHAPVFAEVSF